MSTIWTAGIWGGGSGGGGSTYTTVATYANLPAAASHTGEIYVVLTATGLWPFNRKPSGMYYSNGVSWTYMSAYPDVLLDGNFAIGNTADPTKLIGFDASGITTGTERTIKMADRNIDLNAPTFASTTLNNLSNNTVLYANGSNVVSSLGTGVTTQVLHGNAGGAPSFGGVTEADLTLSNNSTANATTSAHGLLPILSNVATQFLNGQGNFAVPAGISASYTSQAFTSQTSVTVTHNFGAYPIVQILDSGKAVIIPLTITHSDLNSFIVTFTSSTTGTIIASVGSPQPQAVIAVSANYVTLVTDRIIKVTSAAKTVTLLTAVGNTGRMFLINNATSGNVFVNTTSSQTISGQLTQTLPPLSSMDVYSDGANWWII